MILLEEEELSIDLFERSLLNILSPSNSTTSRYDRFITGPSEEVGRIIWLSWAIISGIVAIACLVLISSILLSKTARKNPFNLYITFLTIPDFIFSANCAVTCAICAYQGHYSSVSMCEWQSWYCVFGFAGNSWMNGIIARELYKLLCDSKKGFRYRPPTLKTVYYQCLVIYLYSGFVASWSLFGFLPHKANAGAGLACLPIEYSVGSTLFFWLAFFPAFFGIPFAYVLYVCWNVYKKALLPRSGKTRQIFFFFFRLTCVFIFFWIPSFILMFVTGAPNAWVAAAGGAWSHLQGLASVIFCLTKPGIRKRVLNFMLCGRGSHDEEEPEDSRWTSFTTTLSKRTSTLLRKSSQFFSRDFSLDETPGTVRRKSSLLSSLEFFVDNQQPRAENRKRGVDYEALETVRREYVSAASEDSTGDESVGARDYEITLNDSHSESDDDEDIESLTFMESSTQSTEEKPGKEDTERIGDGDDFFDHEKKNSSDPSRFKIII